MDPDFAVEPLSEDDRVAEACEVLANSSHLKRCLTWGQKRSLHHFKSEAQERCTPCSKTWTPTGITSQGEKLKVVHGRNMWLDAKAQRRKTIDLAIELGAYLYKNNNLRINQRLKVISMCLPLLFSFSAPLVDWPDINLKLLTAIWV